MKSQRTQYNKIVSANSRSTSQIIQLPPFSYSGMLTAGTVSGKYYPLDECTLLHCQVSVARPNGQLVFLVMSNTGMRLATDTTDPSVYILETLTIPSGSEYKAFTFDTRHVLRKGDYLQVGCYASGGVAGVSGAEDVVLSFTASVNTSSVPARVNPGWHA